MKNYLVELDIRDSNMTLQNTIFVHIRSVESEIDAYLDSYNFVKDDYSRESIIIVKNVTEEK